MATILKTVGAQWPLVMKFRFTMADAMVNTSGVLTAFNAAAGTVYDVFTPPPGSQVIGGDLVVHTPSDDTGTATASVGDAGSATRYASAVDIKAAARTALTLTGFKHTSGAIRLTLANQNGNAAAGDVELTMLVSVDGRQNENLKTT